MNEMQIRRGVEKDARQIAAVMISFYNMNLEEAKRTFFEEIRKGHHYVVAEEDEVVETCERKKIEKGGGENEEM